MTRKEKAEEYFTAGYNCAQSVVLAFSDLLKMDEKTLAKISSSFGGGVARMREVCGAVSGMAMVLGLLYGYDEPLSHDAKNGHYKRVQEAIKEFEAENGSVVCRELLGLDEKHSVPASTPRTSEFYKKRPCRELVGTAAEILEKHIEKES